MTKHIDPSQAKKSLSHRAKSKAGLRLRRVWRLDTNSPEFKAEAARQSALVAASPHEAEDQAFIDAISVWNDPDETW